MKSKILDLSIDHSRQYKKQLRSQTSGGMPKEKKPSQRYKKKPKKDIQLFKKDKNQEEQIDKKIFQPEIKNTRHLNYVLYFESNYTSIF